MRERREEEGGVGDRRVDEGRWCDKDYDLFMLLDLCIEHRGMRCIGDGWRLLTLQTSSKEYRGTSNYPSPLFLRVYIRSILSSLPIAFYH